MAKVHIVGAGPCGSIAAMAAIRAGHEAVVSEEHAQAGSPVTCSGLFSLDGLKSLNPFVDYRKFVINSVRGADIHFGGEVLSVRAKGAVACVCDRAAFDSALASNAEREGAKIFYGERVKGQFRADHVIGADGPHSFVARHFGFPALERYVCATKAIIPYRSEDPSVIRMYLSRSDFPGFFGWVIPHSGDTAEFGAGVSLPGPACGAWKRLLKMHGVQSPASVSSDIIPVAPRGVTAKRAGFFRVLLAGDAAGQVKATTGGGVIFGGNCAALAGAHASEPDRYERAWRSRFGMDLMLHRIMRGHVDGLTEDGLSSLGRRMKRLGLEASLSEHGHMDKPVKMLRPGLIIGALRAIFGRD